MNNHNKPDYLPKNWEEMMLTRGNPELAPPKEPKASTSKGMAPSQAPPKAPSKPAPKVTPKDGAAGKGNPTSKSVEGGASYKPAPGKGRTAVEDPAPSKDRKVHTPSKELTSWMPAPSNVHSKMRASSKAELSFEDRARAAEADASDEVWPYEEDVFHEAGADLESNPEAGHSLEGRGAGAGRRKGDDPSDETSEAGASSKDDGGDDPGTKTKKRKRVKKIPFDRLCIMTARNQDYQNILHALYVHRRLTIKQMGALYGYENTKCSNTIRRLYSIGLIERKRVFSVALTLAESRTYHYYLSPLGIRVYAIAMMGIKQLHDDPDLPKQTYLYADLAIGNQTDHHYTTQNFICEVLGRLREQGVCLPSCEWRRYPFFDDQEDVPYRPDWVIFAENDYYSGLVKENRLGEDLLSVPFQTRTQEDHELIRRYYTPAVSIECDTGSMKLARLTRKWKVVKDAKSYITPVIAVLSGDGALGEERSGRYAESKARLRNLGLGILEVLEKELLSEELTFLVGRSGTLSDVVATYFLAEQNLHQFFSGAGPLLQHTLEARGAGLLKERERVGLPMGRGVNPGLPDLIFRVPYTSELGAGLVRLELWGMRQYGRGAGDEKEAGEKRPGRYSDKSSDLLLCVFYAFPGWLNPNAKAFKILERAEPYVHVLLVYPEDRHVAQDVHLLLHERLHFSSLERLSAGKMPILSRVVDRSGERWEVVAEWNMRS